MTGVTAATALLQLPPCNDCAGGGEINGVPCRGCGGRGRQGTAARIRGTWRKTAHGWALAAAGAAGFVVSWYRSVPGIAGAAGLTVGLAGIAHSVWHWLPIGYPIAVIAGVFGLLMDRRL